MNRPIKMLVLKCGSVSEGNVFMGYIMGLRKMVGSRPLIMTGACVLLFEENRLLLQRRTDNGLWGLPGGSMEPGETLEEVAKRELFEETGMIAKSVELFEVFSGPSMYYKYPHGDEVYNVVAAYLCSEFEGIPQTDGVEVQDIQFFTLENIQLEQLSPPDRVIIQNYIARQTNRPLEGKIQHGLKPSNMA